MTFEEMQLIMQSVVISQREVQAELVETRSELREFKQQVDRIVFSNDRTIQALLDQAATDRLRHEERMAKHDEEIAELKHISQGLVNMLDSIDSDRPTILRKLNTIENKTDAIIDRLNRG